jgi:hypothetical protein
MQVQRIRGQQHSNKIYDNNLTEMFLINRTLVMNVFSTMDSHNQLFAATPEHAAHPAGAQHTKWRRPDYI